MKKSTYLLTLMLLFGISANSQILKPITWSYAAKKTSATEATIYLKAKLDEGWHLYSQYVREGGPVKTAFKFQPSKAYILIGETKEPKAITKLEPVFMMEVSYFENAVIFKQKIKVKSKNLVVKGSISFMVCDDQQCLPPQDVEFSIPVR